MRNRKVEVGAKEAGGAELWFASALVISEVGVSFFRFSKSEWTLEKKREDLKVGNRHSMIVCLLLCLRKVQAS